MNKFACKLHGYIVYLPIKIQITIHPLSTDEAIEILVFFFSFYITWKVLDFDKNYNILTGFCSFKGYGGPRISGKIWSIIHTLVRFEQHIFCSCLDFCGGPIDLWKTLYFHLDFSMIRSSIGRSMDFLFQTWIPSIGIWKMLEIHLDLSMIRSFIGKSMDFSSPSGELIVLQDSFKWDVSLFQCFQVVVLVSGL